MRAGALFTVAWAGLIPFASGAERAQAASESVIYTFSGGSDGAFPTAGMTAVGGVLYGTTTQGGSLTCNADKTPKGCGTVFQVTTGGVETVLHAFIDTAKEDDGLYPEGLIHIGGGFYGTAGDAIFGEVFEVAKSGALTVLHTFQEASDGSYNPADGAGPNSTLLNVSGTLYGTTLEGGGTGCGGNGCGTVFQISTGGVETVLYTFQGGANGSNPGAGLVNVNGTLYGTTLTGGSSGCGCSGYGTVFKISTSGVEAVVYSFKGGNDAVHPNGLIDIGGSLYGSSSTGGPNNGGTVFKITTAGLETVLHAFGGGSDGYFPNGNLIAVSGVLYGTTEHGGDGGGQSYGTVFKVTKKGVETVLHAFTGGSDGLYPNGKLVNLNGTLYGTTFGGGGSSTCGAYGGCGTVFQVPR